MITNNSVAYTSFETVGQLRIFFTPNKKDLNTVERKNVAYATISKKNKYIKIKSQGKKKKHRD